MVRITILTQEVQEGYGHAVFCAKEWVKNEPFLLFLDDHIYSSDVEISCTKQVLDYYDYVQKSVIGLKITRAEDISRMGCVNGEWKEPHLVLSITKIYEKPDIEYAYKHLHVEGMSDDIFLTIFGIYVLVPEIFDCLEADISQERRQREEFQLTSGLDQLQKKEGMLRYLIRGRSFDIGQPNLYRQTIIDFQHA